MANYYSSQFQAAYVDVPSNKIAPGDQSGEIKHAAFNVALAGAVTTSDLIKLVKIPKNAKLLLMRFVCSDLGSAGAFNIGWSASADAAQSASANGIVATLDVNTAAVATVYYPNQEFAGEVDIQIAPSTNTTAAGTISGYVMYVTV